MLRGELFSLGFRYLIQFLWLKRRLAAVSYQVETNPLIAKIKRPKAPFTEMRWLHLMYTLVYVVLNCLQLFGTLWISFFFIKTDISADNAIEYTITYHFQTKHPYFMIPWRKHSKKKSYVMLAYAHGLTSPWCPRKKQTCSSVNTTIFSISVLFKIKIN